jgi:hypothetical protein
MLTATEIAEMSRKVHNGRGRIVEGIQDAEKFIAKEMGYSEHLRNVAYLDGLKAHRAKMIEVICLIDLQV